MISALKENCRTFLILALAAGMLFMVRSAAGQQGLGSQPGSNLSPASRAVIDRLASLGELPAGTWKMHAGDLTHGESVNLDESGWQAIAPGEKAPTDAVWFRQTFQVPETLHGYDLTGARIWFQFHAEANGPMPEILYFNGRRVAMGDDLEPIVLFDDARPGDKAVVAVKLLANSRHQRVSRRDVAHRVSPRTGPIPSICGRSFFPLLCCFPPSRPATDKPRQQDRHAERGHRRCRCGGA